MFANCLVFFRSLSLHSRACLGLSALTQPWASSGLRMRISRMIWLMWVHKTVAREYNVITTSQLHILFVLICPISPVLWLHSCVLSLPGGGWPLPTLQQYRAVEGSADPPAGLHATCHSTVWPCSPGENYNSYTATPFLHKMRFSFHFFCHLSHTSQ